MEALNAVDTPKRKTSDSLNFSDSDSGYSQSSSTTNKQSGRFAKNPKKIPATSDSVESFHEVANQKINLPLLPKSVCCVTCPNCDVTMFLDDRGESSLRRNHLLRSIVAQFKAGESFGANSDTAKKPPNRKERQRCEMCESRHPATVRCDQCDVSYCSSCLDAYHPDKGPLSTHQLVQVAQQATVKRSSSSRLARGQKPNATKRYSVAVGREQRALTTPEPGVGCARHEGEVISLHCETCTASICVECQPEHQGHDVKPIGMQFKVQKVCLFVCFFISLF